MEARFFSDVIDFFTKHEGRRVRWRDLMRFLKRKNHGRLPYSQTAIAVKLNSEHFQTLLAAKKLTLAFVRTSSGKWTFGGPVTRWPKGDYPIVFGAPPDRLRTVMFEGLKLRSEKLAG